MSATKISKHAGPLEIDAGSPQFGAVSDKMWLFSSEASEADLKNASCSSPFIY
jgi:hypothetical protein